jgi:hypothetical protein
MQRRGTTSRRNVCCQYWSEALRRNIEAVWLGHSWQRASLLRLAMCLTTILTTIWVRPPKSATVQNPYLQGKSDVRGRAQRVADVWGSRGREFKSRQPDSEGPSPARFRSCNRQGRSRLGRPCRSKGPSRLVMPFVHLRTQTSSPPPPGSLHLRHPGHQRGQVFTSAVIDPQDRHRDRQRQHSFDTGVDGQTMSAEVARRGGRVGNLLPKGVHFRHVIALRLGVEIALTQPTRPTGPIRREWHC